MAGLGPGAALLGLQALPNPNPRRLALLLSAAAPGARLSLYSPALVRLRQAELAGGLQSGWNTLDLPAELLSGLPQGVFFLQVEVRSSDTWGPSSRPLPFVLLR